MKLFWSTRAAIALSWKLFGVDQNIILDWIARFASMAASLAKVAWWLY